MKGHSAGGKERQKYSTKNIWKVKAYIARAVLINILRSKLPICTNDTCINCFTRHEAGRRVNDIGKVEIRLQKTHLEIKEKFNC